MTFLHNDTKGEIIRLVQNGNKSSYAGTGIFISGHLKSYSLEDTTFGNVDISGELFKFTIKEKVNIEQSEKINIMGSVFVVKDVKFYTGISFNTTKILLAKE